MRTGKRIFKYCCVCCGKNYQTHDKHSEKCNECSDDADEKIIIIKESKARNKFTFNDVEYLG